MNKSWRVFFLYFLGDDSEYLRSCAEIHGQVCPYESYEYTMYLGYINSGNAISSNVGNGGETLHF